MIALRAEHRRFALWAAVVLVVILPLWWLWGADLVAAALRPAAGALLKLTGLPGEVRAGPTGWAIPTGLALADGSGAFVQDAPREVLRRLLLGFPLLAAFLIAPPRTRHPFRAALVGALVLSGLFLVSLTAFVWGELAPILNPALAPAGEARAVVLAAPPLHPALAQAALLGRYAGLSVLPLLGAVLVWAFNAPDVVGRLFGTAADGEDQSTRP